MHDNDNRRERERPESYILSPHLITIKITQHNRPTPPPRTHSALLLQAGPLWRAAVLLAAVKAGVDSPSPFSTSPSNNKPNYREAAASIYAYVTEAGLDAVWAASPPFDGEALRGVLPGIPHGPPFRRVMDVQVRGEEGMVVIVYACVWWVMRPFPPFPFFLSFIFHPRTYANTTK